MQNARCLMFGRWGIGLLTVVFVSKKCVCCKKDGRGPTNRHESWCWQWSFKPFFPAFLRKMALSISSSSFTAYAAQTSRGDASAALQDKLERCVKQLGDWEACPSGKTPEGKKIIQNLRMQIASMESRINRDKQDTGTQATPARIAPGASSTFGRLLDVYA
jgi:hypothetical protein